MSTQAARTPTPTAMVAAFPAPGPVVREAYRELHLAANGTDDEKKALGPPAALPRPWEPASCLDDDLRQELWQWLDAVVLWLNTQYSWDLTTLIPRCWPRHPHLVHEIAVLADQRRRAGLALTSDAIEEWHRYGLPSFIDRMKGRLRTHCDDGHQPWPGRPRHQEHTLGEHTAERERIFDADLATLPARQRRTTPPPGGRPHLGVVNPDTGELHD